LVNFSNYPPRTDQDLYIFLEGNWKEDDKDEQLIIEFNPIWNNSIKNQDLYSILINFEWWIYASEYTTLPYRIGVKLCGELNRDNIHIVNITESNCTNWNTYQLKAPENFSLTCDDKIKLILETTFREANYESDRPIAGKYFVAIKNINIRYRYTGEGCCVSLFALILASCLIRLFNFKIKTMERGKV